MRPAYDSGDHLHPGDAGYRAMADMLDMAMLFGAGSESGGDHGGAAQRK